MKINRKIQTKEWKSKNLKIIESYWRSPPATKRSQYFVEYLNKLKPANNFASICEAGCFSGRNCFYIAEAFPGIKVAGFDINKEAVKFAQEKVKSANFWVMDLYDIGKLDQKFDIIFTSGTLIHILPSDIPDILVELVKKANKRVIHIEQLGDNGLTAGPKHLKPSYKVSSQCQWSPDLVSMYKKLGYEPKVIELPEDVRTNGARELLIVEV